MAKVSGSTGRGACSAPRPRRRAGARGRGRSRLGLRLGRGRRRALDLRLGRGRRRLDLRLGRRLGLGLVQLPERGERLIERLIRLARRRLRGSRRAGRRSRVSSRFAPFAIPQNIAREAAECKPDGFDTGELPVLEVPVGVVEAGEVVRVADVLGRERGDEAPREVDDLGPLRLPPCRRAARRCDGRARRARGRLRRAGAGRVVRAHRAQHTPSGRARRRPAAAPRPTARSSAPPPARGSAGRGEGKRGSVGTPEGSQREHRHDGAEHAEPHEGRDPEVQQGGDHDDGAPGELVARSGRHTRAPRRARTTPAACATQGDSPARRNRAGDTPGASPSARSPHRSTRNGLPPFPARSPGRQRRGAAGRRAGRAARQASARRARRRARA